MFKRGLGPIPCSHVPANLSWGTWWGLRRRRHMGGYCSTIIRYLENCLAWSEFQGRNNSININFLVRISRGHSWPLRPDAQGSKSFSPPPGPQENALLVRTSTIFGADVHDPKGCWKSLYKNCFAPRIGSKSSNLQGIQKAARNCEGCHGRRSLLWICLVKLGLGFEISDGKIWGNLGKGFSICQESVGKLGANFREILSKLRFKFRSLFFFRNFIQQKGGVKRPGAKSARKHLMRLLCAAVQESDEQVHKRFWYFWADLAWHLSTPPFLGVFRSYKEVMLWIHNPDPSPLGTALCDFPWHPNWKSWAEGCSHEVTEKLAK